MNKLDEIPEPLYATSDQATPIVLPKRITGHESTKIFSRHLDLLAYVYVRQSQPQQVVNHRESRELQYALVDRAVALGWPRERVVVIDDDQGTTGTAADHRNGFHQLMAEVAMSHVGIILGIDMSRLARCNKDWHQLLE